MIGHYRNLMIVKTVREADDLVQGTPEDLERLRTQAGGISLGAIMVWRSRFAGRRDEPDAHGV